jgi:DNA repair exonuclease SbcCD nuclease subunit
MLVATLNDTHFGVKNDITFMLDYQEKFYRDFFFPTLLQANCKQILHGGDLFDRRKYINFNTLYRTCKMFFDVALEHKITIDIIPGNHDVALKNTNEVNSLDTLIYGYENVNIIQQPIVKEYGSKKIMMLPWMCAENFASSMEYVNSKDADILYGHLELAGFEMYAGMPNDGGMDPRLFSKFSRVWSGHFHHQSNAENIHYLGAPMEYTFADCGDRRGFHIYDTEKDILTFKQNPYTLFEKLYYNDSTAYAQEQINIVLREGLDRYKDKIIKLYVTAKTNPTLFENFVDKLYEIDTIDLTIHESYSDFSESDEIDEDVEECSTREMMDKYIDTAETVMDKTRLKNILNTLYVEALHAEGK